ncbi:MAG: pyrroline-5-carboxylate reductase [Henriciella sp.]|jgi:BMFP domain-containing protein YqiC|uniref:accessory factor UbiK family protein n=1 Tax=Henriciella sp. TaxID=1968823 RepID=UPI000C0E9133|nr:accessory factor UbiK family protein [Henriciella sp.]MAN74392.1 pyrroline-5-carboxylate reductase [Henriciella sp.]MBF34952.1 pyrroline-5-carboxylate reductase [Hyphomonadaceae bacterium]MBK74535.1 pyrroline-5-carboxylate reductase [Henriciella sp.]PHR77254.1 MAG: pyrroline-5-carboxylate reductase [Henriciella sp.]|tara:strand:+ start:844 stop:1089 length:246 start_codon:yes stop_codon:yes gene_type:complete
MANTNPLLDELAGFMTGAMGAARSAGEEARTAMQSRVREFVADMDLVERDEVEALRAIAISALEKVEALEKRVEALEKTSG